MNTSKFLAMRLADGIRRSCRMGAAWLAMCLLALIGSGCNKGTSDREPDVKKPEKTVLSAHKPVQKTFTRVIEATGEVQAFEQTPMFARIGGYVGKVYKDIGDRVEFGEVLAELSVPEMVEEGKQKQALVVQYEKEVERARKLWKAAEANVQFADAKIKETAAAVLRYQAELRRAQSQYERLKKNPGVVAEEVLAETKLGFESASAAVAEAEAKVKSATASKAELGARSDSALADIDVAIAKLTVAHADAGHMEELLKYAKLRAPFAGVVVRRGIDPGHYVQAVGSDKTKPVFVVAHLDSVRVFVDVPENDAVLVDKGTVALVRVQARKGEEFTGTVTRTSWGLDSVGRILQTEIDLPNADEKLRPGMYATASLVVMHENVWSVPIQAVLEQNNQSFCFLYKDGKAWRRQALIGFRDSEYVEIKQLRSPVAASAWVNVDPSGAFLAGNLAGLTEGHAVTVSPAGQEK